jgi:hypothetical protein
MSVRLCNPTGLTEQEFLVKNSIEAAKVGRKAIVINLEVESIMLKFNDEDSARKFSSLVDSAR